MEKKTVQKSEITKIKTFPDAVCIYTENTYFVCEKDSIEDWGKCLAFTLKGKSEDNAN